MDSCLSCVNLPAFFKIHFKIHLKFESFFLGIFRIKSVVPVVEVYGQLQLFSCTFISVAFVLVVCFFCHLELCCRVSAGRLYLSNFLGGYATPYDFEGKDSPLQHLMGDHIW